MQETLLLRYVLFMCLLMISFVYCMKVVPERASVLYVNEKYIMKNATCYVKRYGRKSPYFINVEGTLLHSWGNNVTFDFVFFEYLHNEYRRSFVEIHFKLCDLLSKEDYIGGMLKKSGFICPMPAGDIRMYNLTVPTDMFPYVFPFEKARIDFNYTLTQTGEVMQASRIYVTFKQ